MNMRASDLELLQQYARQNSEEAFAALVSRHLNLAYSAALRQVRSPELAEEVAQSVALATAYWNAHRHPFVWGRRRSHQPRRKPGLLSPLIFAKLELK